MKTSYFKYIAALLLFGSNGIVASRIHLTSYEIVLLRTMIGSLFLIGLFFLSGKRPTLHRYKKDALFIILSGIAMGVGWIFLYEAYQLVGVGVASLLYYCGPVIVMALSPLLFKERLTFAKIVSFLSVLLGIFFVSGNSLTGQSSLFGIFCGLMSAVMYSALVITNKLSARGKGMENSVLQLFASFLTVAIFVGCKSGFAFSIRSTDWSWIIILGLINTGIGCYLYFSSIGSLPVQTIAIYGYLEPLSAVFLSAILLGETMTLLQIAGAVLIIGGTIFAECVQTRRLTRSVEKETSL
jgi:drug/metabolite transporter (DMT)-like permease